MQKKFALLYDFDYTLSRGFMQQFGLMQDLGFTDVYDYFRECENICEDRDMDMCLSLLGGTREIALSQGKNITYDYLRGFGKDVEYYNGVKEWFDKINAVGNALGYEVEHYVISSGLREIVEGTAIAKHFKRIYANFYAYRDGVAFWPSQVVNYTSKTQYIYRVRKNMLDDLASVEDINRKIPDEDELPFAQIIYLGDSQTDIPSFKTVKGRGGQAICLYDSDSDSAKKVAEKCFIDGRVNYFVPADYSEGSDLYNYIKGYMESVATANDQ